METPLSCSPEPVSSSMSSTLAVGRDVVSCGLKMVDTGRFSGSLDMVGWTVLLDLIMSKVLL